MTTRSTMSTRTRSLAVTGAALALAAVTACGSDGSDEGDHAGHEPAAKPTGFAAKSGGEITVAAFDAMKKLHKFRVKGNLVDDGEHLNIDVRADGSGRCAGSLGSPAGGTATFVSTKDATFLKANEKFWKANAGADAEQTMKYLGDRWAKLPASEEFATLCNISELLAKEADLDESDADDDAGVTVGDVSTVAGREVVEVSSKQSKESYTLLIATDEPHYIVQLVSTTPGDPGRIDFSGFDEQAPIKAPAAGEFVKMG